MYYNFKENIKSYPKSEAMEECLEHDFGDWALKGTFPTSKNYRPVSIISTGEPRQAGLKDICI